MLSAIAMIILGSKLKIISVLVLGIISISFQFICLIIKFIKYLNDN